MLSASKPLNKYNNVEIISGFSDNHEMVEMLQCCLEYLGYLEIPYENGVNGAFL